MSFVTCRQGHYYENTYWYLYTMCNKPLNLSPTYSAIPRCVCIVPHACLTCIYYHGKHPNYSYTLSSRRRQISRAPNLAQLTFYVLLETFRGCIPGLAVLYLRGLRYNFLMAISTQNFAIICTRKLFNIKLTSNVIIHLASMSCVT